VTKWLRRSLPSIRGDDSPIAIAARSDNVTGEKWNCWYRRDRRSETQTTGSFCWAERLEPRRHCQRLDGAHLLPWVRAGIKFVDGVQKLGKKLTHPTDNSRRVSRLIPLRDPQLLTITREDPLQSP